MTQISIAIITKNEEARIGACLGSARWADEIVVVDSHSTDATAKIAERHGVKVLLHDFNNFAEQKNFALDQTTKPWVFFLDADEIISEDLAQEIRQRVQDPGALDGYFVLRNNFIFGRCLRHAGQGQDKQMRLFRKGKARFRNVVHEEVDIVGSVGVLHQRLAHHTYKDMNEYLKKFVQYTDLEVRRMRERGVSFCWSQLLVKPWARFIYTYGFRGGFLDGYPGFLFHVLSSFYMFVKYAKLKEAER